MILTAATGAAHAQNAPTVPTERRVRRMILTQPFESSYLGVQTEDISEENLSRYGLAAVRGVSVDKVVENSPAAKGGLRNGDVILKYEGEEVSSVRKLSRLIGETAPDHAARLTVLRDGGEREFSVTLGKREMLPFAGGNFSIENLPNPAGLPRSAQIFPLPPLADGTADGFVFRGGANRQIGISVTPLTRQLGDFFGVAEGGGLLINHVRENSPAAKAGLKAADVIVEVEGRKVQTMTELIRIVSEKKEGDVSLTVVRDKNRQTINVTPEAVKQEKMTEQEFEGLFENAPNQTRAN